MTVALGFMCTDGIVLAADREVSTPTVKIDGPKAWTFLYPRELPIQSCVLVSLGLATTYIKFAAERLDDQLANWIDVHGKAEIDDVVDAIQAVILIFIMSTCTHTASHTKDRPSI